MGDGKTAGINLYANHISSQGKIQFQDFSNTSVDATAFYQTSNNLEWSGRIGGKQERYNKYGFEPKELSFPEDSIAVKFQTWRGRIGVRNINRTDLGLSFAPDVRIDVFNDALGNSESNTNLRLPASKNIGHRLCRRCYRRSQPVHLQARCKRKHRQQLLQRSAIGNLQNSEHQHSCWHQAVVGQ
jgi:hypothetical protein